MTGCGRSSNTYITLVWRDSETNKPVSMGVCIYAYKNREQHDVLGRYLLPDVELTLGDHLETVDGKESPREWSHLQTAVASTIKGVRRGMRVRGRRTLYPRLPA